MWKSSGTKKMSKWATTIMKFITSLLGSICFFSVLYFGLLGGPLPTSVQSESVWQKSKVEKKEEKKKPKVKTETQVAIICKEDLV